MHTHNTYIHAMKPLFLRSEGDTQTVDYTHEVMKWVLLKPVAEGIYMGLFHSN